MEMEILDHTDHTAVGGEQVAECFPYGFIPAQLPYGRLVQNHRCIGFICVKVREIPTRENLDAEYVKKMMIPDSIIG